MLDNFTLLNLVKNISTSATLVTTSLLAVELQSLHLRTHLDMHFMFKQLIKQACHSSQYNLRLVTMNLLNHPIMTVRHILGRHDIQAQAGADYLLEIYPCHPLEQGNYKMMPMVGPCTQRLPISFKLGGPQSKVHYGYLDPVTNVIHYSSIPADCEERDQVPLQLGSRRLLYHRTDAKLLPLPDYRELPLSQWDHWKIHLPKPKTIHQLIMFQWNEVQHPYQISEMVQEAEKTHTILKHLGLDVQQIDVQNPEGLDKSATRFATRSSGKASGHGQLLPSQNGSFSSWSY